jgi:hypothetical protein
MGAASASFASATVLLQLAAPGGPAEGYTVASSPPADSAASSPSSSSAAAATAGATVTVTGNDERGLLFGVGRLIRMLEARRYEGYKTAAVSNVTLPASINITSSPANRMRGHQLGYRPKTNSYDAWTPAQYEQYVVDLALFGTNMIELMPWHTDDDDHSPMFTVEPQAMLTSVSTACDKYGLDFGLWYPLMERNYSDPSTMDKAVGDWRDVLGRLARLDHIQVPAGDPGKATPAALVAAAAALAHTARSAPLFPGVKVWVGPQEWSPAEMAEWNDELVQARRWMSGVVYGPHTAATLARFWANYSGVVAAGGGPPSASASPTADPSGPSGRLPIRLYPDITHSLTTQFPVPEWDRAFAITESREVINPRPTQFAHIGRLHLNWTQGEGFSSYSEGCHDDVNKVVWSAVAWGPDAGEDPYPAGPYPAGTAAHADANAGASDTVLRRAIRDW